MSEKLQGSPAANQGLGRFARPNWRRVGLVAAFVAALVTSAFIFGALPFVGIPTIRQALWASGFAASIADQGWLTVYATHVGVPTPAAIAFGLAAVWVQAGFIRVGLHAADAYSLTAIVFLALALWGALKYMQSVGLRYGLALLMALLWIATPIVWAHVGYSLLSLGMALLPFYAWRAKRLSELEAGSRWVILQQAALFLAVCLLAVFMDGYTFMMYGVAALIYTVSAYWMQPDRRRELRRIVFPIFFGSLISSYIIYALYLGQSDFYRPSVDFFRGWGLDLVMLVTPPKGWIWIWDALGLSVERNVRQFFGDGSVWQTSFSFLIMVLGIIGFWISRHKRLLVYPLLIIALFGTYLSLGPSLKINSQRPAAADDTKSMKSEYALMPTGSEIFAYLPGFKNMRASYRWLALGLVGFWGLFGLLVLWLQGKRRTVLAGATIILAMIAHAPPLHLRTANAMTFYERIQEVDTQLVRRLRANIPPGSLATFLPADNDFLATYLAPAAGIRAHNIGGDKNVDLSRARWPEMVEQNGTILVKEELPGVVDVLLGESLTEYVILPFISLDTWPQEAAEINERRRALQPTVQYFQKDPNVRIVVERYFAIISLARPSREGGAKPVLARSIERQRVAIGQEIAMSRKGFREVAMLYREWNYMKFEQARSGDNPTLRVFVDPRCQNGSCAITLDLAVPSATADRPAQVRFNPSRTQDRPAQEMLMKSNARGTITIPIERGDLSPEGELLMRMRAEAMPPSDLRRFFMRPQARRIDFYGLRLTGPR